MMDQNKRQPITDHEWKIHSINIHGVFFERWCQRIIEDTKAWKLISTNYPVAFSSKASLKESALDIRASRQINAIKTTLLIECKKNNPEFIEWIFFPGTQNDYRNTILPCLLNVSTGGNTWSVHPALREFYFDVLVADEARETRGQYQGIKNERKDKTKTSNSAISEAAYQIALATQAIQIEDIKFGQNESAAGKAFGLPWTLQVYLPTIVTSARILSCSFDPGDVDPTTGEIPFEKASLTEKPYIIYRYALPSHLQNVPEDIVETLTLKNVETYYTGN